MAEHLSILGKESDIHIQESQRIPNKTNLKRTIPRHILMKMSEGILKATREKQLLTNNRNPIRLSAYFFSRNFSDQKGIVMINSKC